MSNVRSDWGFILLCLGLVMLTSYFFHANKKESSVKSEGKTYRCLSAPKAGHGPCPISGCLAIPANPKEK
jgi:hypothetical protein